MVQSNQNDQEFHRFEREVALSNDTQLAADPTIQNAEEKDGTKVNLQRRYIDLDTIIICNPNAMSYQHMINYPHAYYLKYFLSKNMNVLVWNYRGYGRTAGTPEPQHLYYDAE